MLEVYFGSDTVDVRQKAFEVVGEKEEDGATVTYIDGDNYQLGVLSDAAGASSLFGGAELFVLDTPSSNKEFEADVKDNLEILQSSGNTFVVIETALLAALKKMYQNFADTMEESKGSSSERLNVFAIADALANKDKKRLWLLLQEFKREGVPEEELIGILWWQLKSMRLAAVTKSAEEAGMKDFPYNKAKRALSKFKNGELETISLNLLSVYHDGHGGLRDIDLALEKWALTI